jgi:hypothetical protein
MIDRPAGIRAFYACFGKNSAAGIRPTSEPSITTEMSWPGFNTWIDW